MFRNFYKIACASENEALLLKRFSVLLASHNVDYYLFSVYWYITAHPVYTTIQRDFLKHQLRSTSGFGRVRLLILEFAKDVRSLWHYGAPFPTFLKLIGTLLLCLIAIMPLLYPIFVLTITYFIYEGLFLSWWQNQHWLFQPRSIFRRILSLTFQPCSPTDMWKVREVLTRGILLIHSLATSVDYLCVMQGLLDET